MPQVAAPPNRKKVGTAAPPGPSRKLPAAFSFSNRRFATLVFVVLGMALTGSYFLYQSYAAVPPWPGATIHDCATTKPTLQTGVTNQDDCVKTAEAFLNTARAQHPEVHAYWPYLSEPNGTFDSQTRDAVKWFQGMHGTTADGIVGSVTWDRMMSECSSGHWHMCGH